MGLGMGCFVDGDGLNPSDDVDEAVESICVSDVEFWWISKVASTAKWSEREISSLGIFSVKTTLDTVASK